MKKAKVEDISPEDRAIVALFNVTLTLLRLETGFRQWHLARRLNCNITLLNKYLRGHRPIPHKVKEKIIRYLGIDKSLAEIEANSKEANHSKAAAIGR